MGYKPLSGISFAEIQSLLSNLTLITMDGEQDYTIDPTGFDFESGTIKLKDPPPEYALINAHLADMLIHGDHAALDAQLATLKHYCLKCTGTPGATAIYPNQLYIDAGTLNLLMSVRFDTDFEPPVVLYKRHTQSANILEFGINASYELYCTIDATTVTYSWSDFTSDSGQFHDVGVQITDMGGIFFYINGRTTEQQTFDPYTQSALAENLIDVGGAGVSIAWLAVRLHGSWGLFEAERKYGLPLPYRMPAGSINCYDFRPVTGVIPDLAIRSTYKCSLGIQSGNATTEEIVIV